MRLSIYCLVELFDQIWSNHKITSVNDKLTSIWRKMGQNIAFDRRDNLPPIICKIMVLINLAILLLVFSICILKIKYKINLTSFGFHADWNMETPILQTCQILCLEFFCLILNYSFHFIPCLNMCHLSLFRCSKYIIIHSSFLHLGFCNTVHLILGNILYSTTADVYSYYNIFYFLVYAIYYI